MQFGRASRLNHGEKVQRGTRLRKKASRQCPYRRNQDSRRRAGGGDASGKILRGPRPETRRRRFGSQAVSRGDPSALRTGLAAGVPCVYFSFSGVSTTVTATYRPAPSPITAQLTPCSDGTFIRSASHCTAVSSCHSVVTLPQGCFPQRYQKRTVSRSTAAVLGGESKLSFPVLRRNVCTVG